MPLVASHRRWGLIDATRADLGGGLSWETLRQDRLVEVLTCVECGQPMSARVSPLGTRHFFHVTSSPHCRLGSDGESAAHLRLKAFVAEQVRSAGWQADLERAGAGWRADVLASRGSRTIAFEIQVSALDQATAFERTERHLRSGNEIIWLVLGRDQDWRTSLPSLLVAESATDYLVVEGTARLDPERPVEGIGSLAAQDRTVLDFVGEWPTKRGVPVHGWRELIASLGFDPEVVWRYRQGPGLGPTVISETLQGLVRLRARPAALPVVISSVLRGRAVCVARRRPVKYVGTDGRHPRFLWVPEADHDHLLRLFAAAIGWDLESCYEESCGRCGNTASGQGLVEPWGAVEPLMLCQECDDAIHAAITTLVGADPRPGHGLSADPSGSAQVRQGSNSDGRAGRAN